MKKILPTFLGVVVMSSALSTCSGGDAESSKHSNKFTNTEFTYKTSATDFFRIISAFLKTKRVDPKPCFQLPVHTISAKQLLDEKEDTVYRLGHSSIIMKLDGQLLITDPVFSERASPVQWLGPKRFHPSPIAAKDLPNIDVVIISHDHFDHLDKGSIKILANRTGLFLTPLKVGRLLTKWGVPEERIVELDWWQSHTANDIEYTLTPTQHFSGRSLTDRDKTLWGSWVIRASQNKVYFSGDSGYFSGFSEIGKKYGPFDLTLIETGAYNELWSGIHMFPEQSVQAHIDLQGKVMIPIHNSTFDLSLHDWNDPMQQALEIAIKHGVTLAIPEIGQRTVIGQTPPTPATWWQENTASSNSKLSE